MEEMTNTTVEQEQTSDSFMEGWDDTETFASEADQHEEQVEETQQEESTEPSDGDSEVTEQSTETTEQTQETTQQAEAQQQVDAPKQWNLRHMGEVKTVGETEMVTLAQKGMDYDRIRGKYDEAKPVMELFSQFAKQAGMNVTDYVAHIRMQAKQSQGMSEAEARRAVELEDREAVVSAREAEHQAAQDAQTQAAATETANRARIQADLEAFRKVYPDAAKDPKSIPAEVWESVRGGMNLVAAYAVYDAKQARAAQAAAEQQASAVTQNQTNATRSTGSMRSSGANQKSRDPFLEGWGD